MDGQLDLGPVVDAVTTIQLSSLPRITSDKENGQTLEMQKNNLIVKIDLFHLGTFCL